GAGGWEDWLAADGAVSGIKGPAAGRRVRPRLDLVHGGRIQPLRVQSLGAAARGAVAERRGLLVVQREDGHATQIKLDVDPGLLAQRRRQRREARQAGAAQRGGGRARRVPRSAPERPRAGAAAPAPRTAPRSTSSTGRRGPTTAGASAQPIPPPPITRTSGDGGSVTAAGRPRDGAGS